MGKLALLAEQTAYERYVLRAATPLVKGVTGSIDLRRDLRGDITVVLGAADSGRDLLDKFRLTFVPLMFGAAWKILDLVVEECLGPLPLSRNDRPRQWRDHCAEALHPR